MGELPFVDERPHSTTWVTALAGLVVFGTAMLLCVLLRPPTRASAAHGISFYGTQGRTIVPYAAALVAVGGSAWISAGLVPGARTWRPFALRLIAVLMLPVLMTPYTASRGVNVVHDTFAGVCFFAMFCLSLGWGLQPDAGGLVRLLAGTEVVGSLLAFAAFLDPRADMLLGQLVAVAGFLPLLAVVSRRR